MFFLMLCLSNICLSMTIFKDGLNSASFLEASPENADGLSGSECDFLKADRGLHRAQAPQVLG